MRSQVGFWNGMPSRISGGIRRTLSGILLSTVSFESLGLGNLDNPCKIFVGIPLGVLDRILSGIPDGIPGGILELDPKWDPRLDVKSPNIFYICLVQIRIPSGITIPTGILSGIPKTSPCQNFPGGIPGLITGGLRRGKYIISVSKQLLTFYRTI